jgi:MFS family permease
VSNKRIYYGWIVLAIGFLTMLGGYACRNTFSVFYPAIVDEFGWTRGNTALIFSMNVFVYGLVAPVAGGLVDRFKPQYVLATGAVFMGIGMAGCSLASAPWQFYVLYGVLAATGLSMAGFGPIAAIISNWFVRRRALAFGILGAGFGISLIFASGAQYIITVFGWRIAYVAVGLFVALVVAPTCVAFVRRSPRDKGLVGEDGTEEKPSTTSDEPALTSEAHTWQGTEWTLRMAMRTRQYWLFFPMFILSVGIVEQIAISHQVYFYLDAGYSPMRAATFYGVFGICFAIGNIIGAWSDTIGRERFYVPACLVCAGFVALYFLMQDTSTPWLPILISIGFGLSFGAIPCVLNAALADLFHGRHYGKILGTMIMGFAIGGTIGPWLAGYLYDVTGTHTTTYALLIASLLAIAAMMWLAAPRKLSPVRR